MRGSQRPKRLLSKKEVLNLPDDPIETTKDTPENGPSAGRPFGSIGLRKALIQEHCGDSPSRTALELIGAYCKLDEMRKQELSPRELLGILTSQKNLLKMLSDLKQGPKLPSNSSSSDWEKMSLDELKEQEDEYAHLLGQSHIHLPDGSIQECEPDGSGKTHVNAPLIQPRKLRKLNLEEFEN